MGRLNERIEEQRAEVERQHGIGVAEGYQFAKGKLEGLREARAILLQPPPNPCIKKPKPDPGPGREVSESPTCFYCGEAPIAKVCCAEGPGGFETELRYVCADCKSKHEF